MDGAVGAGAAAATGNPPSSTQLEFTQAMSDFKTMFPSMDADVIETVLRSNNGAVDATIDHLLAMSADNELGVTPDTGPPLAGVDHPPDYPPSAHPPTYQQATQEEAADLIRLEEATTSSLNLGPTLPSGPGTRSSSHPGWDLLSDTPHSLGVYTGESDQSQLPPGATSLPGPPGRAYSHPKRVEAERPPLCDESSSSAATGAPVGGSLVPTRQMLQDQYEANLKQREAARTGPGSPTSQEASALAQYLKDERLALMMQNEEFMAELRGDNDFMSCLDQEANWSPTVGSGSGPIRSPPASSAKSSMDEALFREKLRNMGKSSKRKFTQLAGMFSRRKGNRPFLGATGAPSKDNLLLNSDSLTGADEDDEDGLESEGNTPEMSRKTPSKGKYTSFS
ncbi:hypothetical protein TCAL_06457 [Tigriopus californicus]|uniref:CUE domain-containing protein n=1 Tax=Tigriopus californicus TaxID=6832 RepID=A0A553PLQ5_TIGCA|nr:CUE domain-containing protein 1-like [Tigriopus californicus]TRY78605.1 hypothetical protein TCAL_06457 [Tigriopus californicus]|eukprot:TCALIF_06457-PA protein Name:"Similar to CUEDC1 CUE domain-containing protein 1 (Homo sapiens)" AED:0.06 eAED:0.21 QI:0/-1/0/1/-1/1/1/0/394